MTLREREAGAKKVRVLVVDDHLIVCEGIKRIVDCEPDMEVCGYAARSSEVLPAITEAKPDAVLLDISLSDGDGMAILRDIVNAHPILPVVMYSMHVDSFRAGRALSLGAKGYITKSESPSNIPLALRKVVTGGVYINSELTEGILKNMGSAGNRSRQGASSITSPSGVTERQQRILEMIVKGWTTREIGRALGLSARTVEKHRQTVAKKLNARNLAELIANAIRKHMVK